MKGLGRTSPFHQFTNPQCDKSVYFWSWSSYLLFIRLLSFMGLMILQRKYRKIKFNLFITSCICDYFENKSRRGNVTK